MKIIGIIAEYNPFHNGHLYQIKKIKEKYKDSLIIVVLSSSFSQRGEPIILSKHERTDIILNNNVDIVIELPYVFSTQSADIFAKGAISILNSIGINTLSFGIESDINNLQKAAEIQLNNKDFDLKVKEYMDKKYNYRSSVAKSIFDLINITVDSPNDILAVSYIKEILKQNKNIEILPIKRTSTYTDLKSKNKIVSASNIRNKLGKENIKKYVPKETYKYLKNFKYNDNLYFKLLKYKLFTNNNLNNILLVDEGIENRINKYIKVSNNINELISNIKTKRYTENKIRRTLCHILCDYTKEKNKEFTDIEYIKILGFNEKGKKYLNIIKNKTKYQILTNYKKGFHMLEEEIKISQIYDLLTNKNTFLDEYKKGPNYKN
ncbi:MAG: nucleotidyltransferase [Bacilli bacterium]|nr:nucleotidyltransferase [Bacilli bacterium]